MSAAHCAIFVCLIVSVKWPIFYQIYRLETKFFNSSKLQVLNEAKLGILSANWLRAIDDVRTYYTTN